MNNDVVTPHLEIEVKHISEKTPSFAEQLAHFLQHQDEGVPWLRLSTLRMMAQSLKRNYEQIDGLLEILENRDKEAQL